MTERLYFVSHTHWDREWYEPFQVFRLMLVRAMDGLLDLLARDPDYRYFMLDGQTIVLEDYAEVRPERMPELLAHIAQGRVLVGPWYVLPDMFLVSGEALIRNLQRGMAMAACEAEGAGAMRVGYIPDPFGHISQMPQILRGMGLDTAVFRRGLADEPVELAWDAPDGSSIFTIYLRDSYDNAAWLRRTPDEFAADVQGLAGSLRPHQRTPDLLMMNGTDHMAAWPELSALLADLRQRNPDIEIHHSTLPEYIAQVRRDLGDWPLPHIRGELRNPKKHHLLPGVLSTRMWIKQRNARSQTLLEKWAEPLAAYAAFSDGTAVERQRDTLHLAWKYLLQNHPHDSICGCSVDAVHEEMRLRFDAVDQVTQQVVTEAEATLAAQVNTTYLGAGAAVIVWNPNGNRSADIIEAQVEVPGSLEHFSLVDALGQPVRYHILDRQVQEYLAHRAGPDEISDLIGMAEAGQTLGMAVDEIAVAVNGDTASVDVTLAAQQPRDPAHVHAQLAHAQALVAERNIREYDVRVHSPVKLRFCFHASGVPAHGYTTYYLLPSNSHSERSGPTGQESPAAPDRHSERSEESRNVLENEYLRVEPEPQTGAFVLTDKRTGAVYRDANRFEDTGDRGDLYNFAAAGETFDTLAGPVRYEWVERNPFRQVLRACLRYALPAALDASDRRLRSACLVDMDITTTLTLIPGLPRLDIHTEIDNRARDHRLRVRFGTPIHTEVSLGEQAFDLVTRPIALPPPGETLGWIEQPVGTVPMQGFMSVQDANAGLMLAARGLPEYEVLPGEAEGGVTLALTLLRCVEWLSRDDFDTRRGHAGPMKHTPGAQELGLHAFDYCLVPFGSSTRIAHASASAPHSPGSLDSSADAPALARAFLAPSAATATYNHDGPLPPVQSFVTVEPSAFVLTACKPPDEGAGLIARGCNMSNAPIVAHLRLWRSFEHAALVNMAETELAPVELREGREVSFPVRPHEIVTVRFS